MNRLLIIGATVIALSATATIALAGTEPVSDIETGPTVQMQGQDIDPVIASIVEQLRSARQWHTDHVTDRAHDRSTDVVRHKDQVRDHTMDTIHDTDQVMDQVRDHTMDTIHDTDQVMDQVRDHTMDTIHDTDQVMDQVQGDDGIVDDQDMSTMGNTDSMGSTDSMGNMDNMGSTDSMGNMDNMGSTDSMGSMGSMGGRGGSDH